MPNLFIRNDSKSHAIKAISLDPAGAAKSPVAAGATSPAISLAAGKYALSVVYEGQTAPQLRTVVMAQSDVTEAFTG